jgi:hypothetical protein
MRNVFVISLLVCVCHLSHAQDPSIEAAIRKLEQLECTAVLEKDTVTLRTLWADDYTVNSPGNRVVTGGRNTLDRPVITQSENVSFTRVVEHVMLRAGLAIVMGHEVVVPKSSPAAAIRRRYTNIWINDKGDWKLIARHASIICN